MHLISIFLPLHDNHGRTFARDLFREVAHELTTQFGGLTAHSRAPAEGLWQSDGEAPPTRDDIVIYEVITETVDRAWWSVYRAELERRFRQEQVLIRAQQIDIL